LCLLVAGAAALLVLQRRLVTAEITPRPLLYLVADTQREVERIPLELTRVSDKEEMQIGGELVRSYGLVPRQRTDPDAQRIAAYVWQVGQRLAANVKRKGIQYRFHYRDERNFVNAGALPGGQIVIGRGLLELLESEDELAAILGHEIAHVDERHCIERLQYEMTSRKIGMRGLYRLAQIGVILFQMGYSKEKEDEADRVGLSLAVQAGYSPAGAVEVMKRFDRLYGRPAQAATSPVEEILQMPLKSLGEYFRSHAPARERVATLEKEIQAQGYNVAQVQKPMGIRAVFIAEHAAELDRRGMFERAMVRYQEALKAEPEYAKAWEGLTRASWRAGDAAEAARAAAESLKRNTDSTESIGLLARAVAAENRKTAAKRFEEALASQPAKTDEAIYSRRVELAGLELTLDTTKALKDYRQILALGHSAAREADLRRRMAWWMYRGGMLPDAMKELEAARQRFPQAAGLELEMAWVLSDMGRQADALSRLQGGPGMGGVAVTPEDRERPRLGMETGVGGREAVTAVINWRTERRDQAKTAFQRAAEADPPWMVAKWVANNYSAEAAAVIAKLQAEETARRRLVELRAGRGPAGKQAPQ